MTSINHKIAILASSLAIAGAAIALTFVSQSSTTQATNAFSQVINPDIPKKLQLCGEEISLDRADRWERFDRELTAMTYGHGTTLLMLKRANKYFPRIEPILKRNGIPTDLLYLACVESTLDQRALSPAKAAGMWQFMPDTAKQYGLEVNDEVDERYNIEKATDAACQFFKTALGKYGNWETVMASYNAGMGRLSRETEAQGETSSFDLFLPTETTRYVYRILAAKSIMENPRAFGFELKPEQLYQPAEFKEVEVSGSVPNWIDWAHQHGIKYADLLEANPWIRARKLTNPSGNTYSVKIPTNLVRSKQDIKVFNHNWVK